MNTIRKTLVLLPAMAFLFNFCAWAGEISSFVSGYAVINGPDGNQRLLIKVPFPEGVADSSVGFAELNLAITPSLAEDSILRINCHIITSPWQSDNVAWDNPWQNYGGDFEADELTMFTTSADGGQSAYFDLTAGIRAWLGGSKSNYGIILIIPDEIKSRYEANGASDLPPGAIGALKFVTR